MELKLQELHETLIKPSSPLTGYLGREMMAAIAFTFSVA
jgi:hypothetical protein